MTQPTQTNSSSSSSTWGTWEELLLACAVKRHGFKNWDTVSMELQSRTSLPHLLTSPTHCQQKYHDLHRRFAQNDAAPDSLTVPWVDELRKLRVAELKQEVQRYDVSILSLQSKVKRLEEERSKRREEKDGNKEEADLERGNSENDKGGEPEKSDRSVNESNSTGGSEKSIEEKEKEESEQSWASLGRKEVAKCGSKSEPLVGLLHVIRSHRHFSLFNSRLTQSQETEDYKSTIRQHQDLETIQTRVDTGAYSDSDLPFYRDLLLLFNNAILFFPKPSVESEAAHQLRSLVSTEIGKQTHKSDSTPPQPPPSPKNLTSLPKRELERSDSLLALHKSSVPLIVCRKRSSLSTKPSSSGSVQKNEQQKQQSNENKSGSDVKQPVVEQSSIETKSEDKAVAGARSSRRNAKSSSKPAGVAKKKQNSSPTAKAAITKAETPKPDKKKTESLPADKKKSVADFLKRIKKNSPVDPAKKSSNRGAKGSGQPKSDSVGKGQTGKDRVLRKSGDRKPAKEDNSPSKKNTAKSPKPAAETSKSSEKRGRESSAAETKRPKKRARR